MMTISDRVQAYASGIVVLRDIDSGYKSGFWLIPMTGEEFEAWWLSQETFVSDPDGTLAILCKIFNEELPPLRKNGLPGELLVAETDTDDDLWSRMWGEHRYYTCALCCDQDAYLRRPDGTILHHKGFKGSSPG